MKPNPETPAAPHRTAGKRTLMDDIIRRRNAFAETVMKDVEQRREELKATGTGL